MEDQQVIAENQRLRQRLEIAESHAIAYAAALVPRLTQEVSELTEELAAAHEEIARLENCLEGQQTP